MTVELEQELFEKGEITLAQKLSIEANNREPAVVVSNQGYSVEYWTSHLHYVILGEPKLEEDNSNATWTEKNYNALISGNTEDIFGLSGINGVIALMEFIKLHNTDKYEIAIEALNEYAHNENNQNQIDYANSL